MSGSACVRLDYPCCRFSVFVVRSVTILSSLSMHFAWYKLGIYELCVIPIISSRSFLTFLVNWSPFFCVLVMVILETLNFFFIFWFSKLGTISLCMCEILTSFVKTAFGVFLNSGRLAWAIFLEKVCQLIKFSIFSEKMRTITTIWWMQNLYVGGPNYMYSYIDSKKLYYIKIYCYFFFKGRE